VLTREKGTFGLQKGLARRCLTGCKKGQKGHRERGGGQWGGGGPTALGFGGGGLTIEIWRRLGKRCSKIRSRPEPTRSSGILELREDKVESDTTRAVIASRTRKGGEEKKMADYGRVKFRQKKTTSPFH